MLITPPYLKKGDTIAIISTARKISKEVVSTSIEVFESWELKVITSPNLFAETNQFSGTDEQRLESLQWALDNDEIKAIICARGGYGTTRIIDKLDLAKFRLNPKWVAGFSDVTALLFHLQGRGIECIHSIMPVLFATENAAVSVESLRKALFGEQLTYTCNPHSLNRQGRALGEIAGGNLSLIHNLIATKSDLDLSGKILFIEDIDEYLYHIDRMMGHLQRAGKLEKLAGLVVGHFSDMKDNTIPFGKTAEEIIIDNVKNYDYPVCFGFPVGHSFDNLTLICGREAILDINSIKTSLNLK